MTKTKTKTMTGKIRYKISPLIDARITASDKERPIISCEKGCA